METSRATKLAIVVSAVVIFSLIGVTAAALVIYYLVDPVAAEIAIVVFATNMAIAGINWLAMASTSPQARVEIVSRALGALVLVATVAGIFLGYLIHYIVHARRRARGEERMDGD